FCRSSTFFGGKDGWMDTTSGRAAIS
ncbi:hypothetical protein STIAU_4405, partial [Stigmatella aurantiaca DW4/3-1]